MPPRAPGSRAKANAKSRVRAGQKCKRELKHAVRRRQLDKQGVKDVLRGVCWDNSVNAKEWPYYYAAKRVLKEDANNIVRGLKHVYDPYERAPELRQQRNGRVRGRHLMAATARN